MNSYGIKKEIDPLGRITVPKPYREALGINLGDEVEICLTDEGILLVPTKKNKENENATQD